MIENLYRERIATWPTAVISVLVILLLTRIASGFASRRAATKVDNGVKSVPLLPYWFPYLGHIPDMVLWPTKLLERSRDLGLGLMGVNFAGMTHTLVFDPDMIKTVFSQKPSVLSFESFGWFFASNIGGVPNNSKPKYDAGGRHELEVLYSCLRDSRLPEMMSVFVAKLEANINNLVSLDGDQNFPWSTAARAVPVGQDGVEVSLLPLLVHFVAHQAVPSIFGSDLLRVNPNFVHDLMDFNDGFVLLATGVSSWFPWPKLRRARRGRDRVTAALARLDYALEDQAAGKGVGEDFSDLESVSVMVKERSKACSKYGIAPEERPSAILAWALNANSNFLVFWILLHVLSTPAMVEEIRKETKPYIHSSTNADGTPSIQIDEKQLCASCGILKACMIESLRLNSATWSLKEVVKDFHLSGSNQANGTSEKSATNPPQYVVKGGTYLHVASDLHFMDPVYFPSPKEWRPERHLVASDAGGDGKTAQWNTVRPWGGGSSMCKGRMYAEREIMATIAALLAVWDFEPVGTKDWKLPVSKKATGVHMPSADIRVIVKKRA